MRSPKDKAAGYTAVACICAIVVYVLIGVVSAGIVATAMPGSYGLGPTVSESGGAASTLSGLFGGKSDADRQRVAGAVQALANMG
jgi:hypothetical protein